MRKLIFVLPFLSILIVFSCKKDEFDTSPSSKVEFSQDTVMFDTVFTTVGSATQIFTVYNRNSKAIKISSINIAGGAASYYRLNVDGVPGKSFTNVEIGANDSMFVFAEVTLDPNNLNTPFIVTDSIQFVTNGVAQYVDLVAFGQDAIFHRPASNSPNGPFFIVDCNEVWSNTKPHVVYGYALVDSGCTLTITEGTNVHFHPGSGIIVLNSGTLNVSGTQQNKVTLEGDRLGQLYSEVAGQWDRIWLSTVNVHTNRTSEGPKTCTIKNAIIKNGTVGLLADSFNTPGAITLDLENTVVKNMSSHAIATRSSNVAAYNSVFANCGAQNANILYGGNLDFLQCTFANFWNGSNRQDAIISLNNYYTAVRTLNANFRNCIVYGNNEMELALDSFPASGQFNFLFDHAILKVENTFSTSNSHYISILRNVNPIFKDPDNNDYHLDSLNSPARNVGDPSVILLNPIILGTDLDGTPRINTPDLGAYETQ